MTFFISSSERRAATNTAVRCLLFLLGGLLLLHVAGQWVLQRFPMRAITRLKSQIEDPRCGLADCHIITLGNSHNLAAIAPHTFADPLKHLATPLQSLSGSLFYLRYFRNRIRKARVVLLPVSIGMLEQDTQLRPITVLNLVKLDGWRWEYLGLCRDLDILIRSWAVPIARMDAWRGPIESACCDTPSSAKPVKHPFEHDRVARHLAFLPGADADRARLRNLENLRQIAEICRELDACLVLYESPVSLPYRQSFASQRPDYRVWKDTVRCFVNESRTRLPVFFLEDLWTQEELNTALYYKDQEHLSRPGRLHFSQRLRQRLATELLDTRYGDLKLCQRHHPGRSPAGIQTADETTHSAGQGDDAGAGVLTR